MVGTISKPVQQFDVAVSMGAVVNTNNQPYLEFSKFGSNADISTGAFEAVSSISQAVVFTAVAESVRVRAGGDAADDAAGAGARDVTVIGLDENFDLASELIVTAGPLASAFTTIKFWRVFSAIVGEVGTYGGANVGDILIENESQDLKLRVVAGTSFAPHAAFSTPRDHTTLIRSLTLVVEGGKEVDFRILTRAQLDNTTNPRAVRTTRAYNGITAGVHQFPYLHPIVLAEKTDVSVVAQADQGGGAAIASALLDLLIIPGSVPGYAVADSPLGLMI